MPKVNLEQILACPNCKTSLNPKGKSGKCPNCRFAYSKENGIWRLLLLKSKRGKYSKESYDSTHLKSFRGPSDGSYEILASFARGNKTLDIACGQGHIEKLAPNTVGVEFSDNALKIAQKNGARHLVLADAHALPFKNNSFDLSISSGNLEHFANPQKAIQEMARISKIQVLTVHRHPPIPGAVIIHKLITILFGIKHQPIERPMSERAVVNMLEKANLHVVFRGVWTIPINYGRVIKFLPEFKNIPACTFVISVKK